MEKKIMTFALIMMAIISQAQTLEECQQAAKKNYPCIKKYDLIYQTTELTVKNIKKDGCHTLLLQHKPPTKVKLHPGLKVCKVCFSKWGLR